MNHVKYILTASICFYSFIVLAQSNSNSSGQPIPINADPAATPPPVQTTPASQQTNTPPINKVMLKSQVDSMDSKKRATPVPSQRVYRDSTRYRIYEGDTITAPVKKYQYQ